MNRPDGRKVDETRPVEAKVGIIGKADGSAMFRIGNTVAIAAVYGPTEVHPRHLENPEKAIVKCIYDMYSFSVPERKRPGPDRRSIELSMVIRNSVLPAIMVKEYPNKAIELYVSIIQADAGTRCAAISAASMALADAGIAMKDMVASVAAGRINDTVVLDLNKEEEDIEGTTDIPLAYMPRMKKVTLLQLDGKISGEDVKNAIDMGIKGCEQIYEVQKAALKEKYKNTKVVE
ncbi:MAG TPA: exosome complex exonuclease Rrp41 [Candidatus Woesearchaeota archaeon]|nr:exosome complex exonuclease Rrp41 [Candidatus Woesearchaeota archaeon]